MPNIHEVATVTSKGQITLPKPIRQALGIAVGGKVAFDLRGTEVIVSRANSPEHTDPAISAFLALLESDIKSGRHVTALPPALAHAMLDTLQHVVDEDIAGAVDL
jgi:antitoxin PrlF